MKGEKEMTRRLKTREELIKEGKPYIEYSTKDGMLLRQVFLTERARDIRKRELEAQGVKVTVLA
jgi:hypothetical protein